MSMILLTCPTSADIFLADTIIYIEAHSEDEAFLVACTPRFRTFSSRSRRRASRDMRSGQEDIRRLLPHARHGAGTAIRMYDRCTFIRGEMSDFRMRAAAEFRA